MSFASKEKPAKSGVYIFKVEGEDVYKIRVSCNPVFRLRALQTACPYKIYPTFFRFCNDARKLESTLHSMFLGRRLLNEWFELSHEEVKRAIFIITLSNSELNSTFKNADELFDSHNLGFINKEPAEKIVLSELAKSIGTKEFSKLVKSHLDSKAIVSITLARLLADNYQCKCIFHCDSESSIQRIKGKDAAKELAIKSIHQGLLHGYIKGKNSIILSAKRKFIVA